VASTRKRSGRDDPGGQAAPRDTARLGTVEGGLLAVTAEGIVGWARDLAAPAESVRVILLANDEPLARAVANGFDHPIVRARVGPGVPGFVVRLPRLPRAPFPLRLTLRDGRGQELGPPLPLRRREDLLPAVGEAPSHGDYDGNVDGLRDGTLIGWAMSRSRPDEVLVVKLHDGAHDLAEARAQQFRPDLQAAGKRDGTCGFTFELPVNLLDGRPHSLRVTIADTEIELPNSPVVFGPGAAKDILDDLARLRGEVERLAARVADLISPQGELQREIVRTLADRMAAITEVQRDLVERELDALRRIALGQQALLPEPTMDHDTTTAKRRR
jgi:hypothetical protein